MKKSLFAVVFLAGGIVLINAQTTEKAAGTKSPVTVKANAMAASKSAPAEFKTATLDPVNAVKSTATLKQADGSTQKMKAAELKQDEATIKTAPKKYEAQ